VVEPTGVRVRFVSDPAGAEVYLGGRALGKTAFDAVLDGGPGPREFTFKMKGYADSVVRGEVADGGTIRAALRRKAQPAPVPKPKPGPRPAPGPKPKEDDYPEP
jgi:hypothetical protein